MTTRSLLVSAALVLFAVRSAAADDPNRVFSGQIIAMAKRPPATAKSPGAYVQLMRKMKQFKFVEDKTNHTWTLWLACFLSSPLNDVEYSIKYYEMQGRTQQFLASSDNFTDSRGEKTILTKVTIDKKWAGVNKNLLVRIENKGKVLASTQIQIIGEGERFSGKVNFSEEEAAGKEDADDDAKKKDDKKK